MGSADLVCARVGNNIKSGCTDAPPCYGVCNDRDHEPTGLVCARDWEPWDRLTLCMHRWATIYSVDTVAAHHVMVYVRIGTPCRSLNSGVREEAKRAYTSSRMPMLHRCVQRS